MNTTAPHYKDKYRYKIAPGIEFTADTGFAKIVSIKDGKELPGIKLLINKFTEKNKVTLITKGTIEENMSDKNGGTPSGILIVIFF